MSSSSLSSSTIVPSGSAGAGSGAPIFNIGNLPLWYWLEQNSQPVPLTQVMRDREYLLKIPGQSLKKVKVIQDATSGSGTIKLTSDAFTTPYEELSVNNTISKLYEIPAGVTTELLTTLLGGKRKKRKTRGKKRKAKKTRKN